MSRIPVVSILLIAGLGVLTSAKPIVDPGLFVILGVSTCREGLGYCLLGADCTLDEDFLPDDLDGHCDGLRNAFTPSAHFICCKYNAKNTTTVPSPESSITSEASTAIDDIPDTPAIVQEIVEDVNIISSSQLELKPEMVVTYETTPAANTDHVESDVNVLMVNAEDLKIDSDVDQVDHRITDTTHDPPKPENVVEIMIGKPGDVMPSENQETRISLKTDEKESSISELPVASDRISSDHVVVDESIHESSALDAVSAPDKLEEHAQNNDWSPIIYTLSGDNDKDNIKEIELDVQIPVEGVAAPQPQAREPISVSVITLDDSSKPEQVDTIIADARRIIRL